MAGWGKSEKFWTLSATTCEASSPNPSEADTLNVPEDLIIEKLLSPIFVKVKPPALIEFLTPSLMSFVFVFDEVNEVVAPSIVIEDY